MKTGVVEESPLGSPGVARGSRRDAPPHPARIGVVGWMMNFEDGSGSQECEAQAHERVVVLRHGEVIRELALVVGVHDDDVLVLEDVEAGADVVDVAEGCATRVASDTDVVDVAATDVVGVATAVVKVEEAWASSMV